MRNGNVPGDRISNDLKLNLVENILNSIFEKFQVIIISAIGAALISAGVFHRLRYSRGTTFFLVCIGLRAPFKRLRSLCVLVTSDFRRLTYPKVHCDTESFPLIHRQYLTRVGELLMAEPN